MSIPFYAAQAHGGKIVSVDDQAVVKDLAAADGTGGNSYSAYVVTASPEGSRGYSKLRRTIQRVPHDGAVTVTLTPWRDGLDTGQTISRTLASNDNPEVTAPHSVTGSVFNIKITLSSFNAPASLGSGEVTIVPRRSQR